jgi:flagellar biosynthesis/type III secretory pathway M-ring protein FliF/YscJ
VINRTPEEVEKLRRIVSNVLGADTVRGDLITVEEMSFNDELATEVTHTLETQERRDFWWTLAHKLAYPALAIGVLLVFLLLFKRTAKDEIPLGIPVGRLTLNGGNGNGNGNGNGKGHRPAYNERGGEASPEVVTVEVLNQLIKENPQNMTQAIRGWLERGANSSKQ